MLLTQYIYRAYIRTLSAPLILGLILIGWKKSRIQTNLRMLRLPVTFGFRLRFYINASIDALEALHGLYGRTIISRPRDHLKLNRLRTGSSILVSAHFHNWELMGSWLCIEKAIPLLSAALPFKHPVSQYFLEKHRRRLRIPIIQTDIARLGLKHLRAGKCLGIVWDQYPSHGQVRVPFFSHLVRVNPLPGFLADKSQAPVFFGALLPGGVFRLVQISQRPRPGLTLEKLANRYHRVLEILIRSRPDFWYGFAHRRFKDQILYEVTENVSRETTSSPLHLVSRETKLPE